MGRGDEAGGGVIVSWRDEGKSATVGGPVGMLTCVSTSSLFASMFDVDAACVSLA